MPKFLEKYQSKSITPVDEYECKLSDELIARAKEEIGETPEIRDQALEEFREWIWNNPRIEKCRMDSKFLLRFLRVTKYSIVGAKEMYERYLVFREGLYGYDWFTNLDTERPGIQEHLDSGLFSILPNYSKTGEKIVFVRGNSFIPTTKNFGNVLFSMLTMVMETLLDDEETQIRGYRMVVDSDGAKLKYYFTFTFKTWFRILKTSERTFAGRHRGCHILNLNPALMFMWKLVQKYMKERQKNDVTFFSTPEEFDFMDLENLPEEYGGKQKASELIEEMKHRVNSRRDVFLNYSRMKVNYEYYTSAVLNCDTSTLSTRLLNRKGKLLKKYFDGEDED